MPQERGHSGRLDLDVDESDGLGNLKNVATAKFGRSRSARVYNRAYPGRQNGNPDSDTFCTACGFKLDLPLSNDPMVVQNSPTPVTAPSPTAQRVADPQRSLNASSRETAGSGSSVTTFCESCGATIEPDSDFCVSCGVRLRTENLSAPPADLHVSVDNTTAGRESQPPITAAEPPPKSGLGRLVIGGIGLLGIVAFFALRTAQSGGGISSPVSSALTLLSGNGLTRTQAASVIQSSTEFSQADVLLQVDDDGIRFGQQAALWRDRTGPGPPGLELAPNGQKYFKDIGLLIFAYVWVKSLNPLRREVVSITGIADTPLGEKVKEAQFSWQWAGSPAWVATVDGKSSGTGSAIFRQFDDGWRIEQVHLQKEAQELRLIARQLPGIDEVVRQAQEDAARRQSEQAEQAQRAAQERASRVAILMNEKAELERTLDWVTPASAVVTQSVNVGLPTGASVPGILTVYSDGINLESSQYGGRRHFWNLSFDVPRSPFNDRIQFSGDLRLFGDRPSIAQLYSTLRGAFDRWQQSDLGRRQVSAQERLRQLQSELASLR